MTVEDQIARARELLDSLAAAFKAGDQPNQRNAAYELVRVASDLHAKTYNPKLGGGWRG